MSEDSGSVRTRVKVFSLDDDLKARPREIITFPGWLEAMTFILARRAERTKHHEKTGKWPALNACII